MTKRQTTLAFDRATVKLRKTINIGDWSKRDGCLAFRHSKSVNSNKIASFDFDSTLVKTKSGGVFPKTPLDWVMWDNSVLPKLKSLHEEGYKLVIFSNQNGVGRGRISESFIRERFNDFISTTDLPIDAYIATAKDEYRKPNTGMWLHMLSQSQITEPNMHISFFCGDAAGRPNGWQKGKKRDFSCTDRIFAYNLMLPFYTPEELFLQDPPCSNFSYGNEPSPLKTRLQHRQPLEVEGIFPTPLVQEVVVLVGIPVSGKSTFARKHFLPKDYVHIERETLRTSDDCLELAKESLNGGKSIVIDDTNPSEESRAHFVQLAKESNVPVRCLHFHDVDANLSFHLSLFRERKTGKSHKTSLKESISYRTIFSRPSTSEGFDSVVDINFIPEFESKQLEEAFYNNASKF